LHAPARERSSVPRSMTTVCSPANRLVRGKLQVFLLVPARMLVHALLLSDAVRTTPSRHLISSVFVHAVTHLRTHNNHGAPLSAGRLMNGAFGSPCVKDHEPTRLKGMLTGCGRSGTSSLRLALETMGLNPWHGGDALNDPAVIDALIIGDSRALVSIAEQKGYDVTLEVHRRVALIKLAHAVDHLPQTPCRRHAHTTISTPITIRARCRLVLINPTPGC
jgi:hypothetical protein